MKTVRHWWLLLVSLSLVLLALDYVTGPLILFPITFVLPICLAAWHLGQWPGVALGLALTGSRFALVLIWSDRADSVIHGAINAAIHLVIFVGLASVVARLAAQTRELARRVQVLEGLLPICSFCKKIRHQNGEWERIETYISKRSAAEFSHGLCQECAREHYGEYFSTPDSQAVEGDAAPGRGDS